RGRRMVELAVRDARARAHALHVAGTDDRARPQAVLVRERAVEDVAHDLHVLVPVRREAAAGLHAVLVDDAEVVEAHEARVAVPGERERVIALEPAVLGMATLVRSAQGDHSGSFPPLPWRDKAGRWCAWARLTARSASPRA